MKIHLKQRYRGALTNEQWLAYGEYDASELPNGLAQYLVDNGHATVIEADSKPIARERADKTLTASEYTAVPAYELGRTDTHIEIGTEDDIKAEYERLFGEPPHWNMKVETMIERIKEAKDED